MSRQPPVLELHNEDKRFLYYRALDLIEEYSDIPSLKSKLLELQDFMSPLAFDFLVSCINQRLKVQKLRKHSSEY